MIKEFFHSVEIYENDILAVSGDGHHWLIAYGELC